MSLNVSDEMVTKAQADKINEEDFVSIIKDSLPKAWVVVEKLITQKKTGHPGPSSYDDKHMNDETRGEILRMFASNSIRGAIENHFGVALAFQNCHRAAVFTPTEVGSQEYEDFISIKSQILNQSPQMRDC